jgi:acyl carrier protein
MGSWFIGKVGFVHMQDLSPVAVPQHLIQRILGTVAKAQRLPLEKVTLESTFEELGIDSLDGISLVFALEQEFNISIPDDEARSIRSVRQIVEGVARLLPAPDGA